MIKGISEVRRIEPRFPDCEELNDADGKPLVSQWTMWRGPIEGNGTTGEEYWEQESIRYGVFSLPRIEAQNLVYGGEQNPISLAEKLERIADKRLITLDPGFGEALYREQGQIMLRQITTLRLCHITRLDFLGAFFRRPDGVMCAMALVKAPVEKIWLRIFEPINGPQTRNQFSAVVERGGSL